MEHEITVRFAVEHGLKQPSRIGPAAGEAAQALRTAVLALPELGSESGSARPAPVTRSSARPSAQVLPDAPIAAGSALSDLLSSRKLVILGGLAGRDRTAALPSELLPYAEVIDTERDGVHAIGNLPQRIRHGRVAGIIILDRSVQHKHTEPVVAAARDAGTPVAFAGQGGKASLLRALEQIEEMLSKSSTK